jgi:membrane fusion protein, heavy metal efflux system
MKERNPRFPLNTWAAVVMCFFTSTSQAADQPVKFAVPNTQIKALGIQTTPLQSQTDSVKMSFPAQAVVPPQAEQVVSSPVAGLVAQLLVEKNQILRAGEPLVRITSPELGQLQLQLLQAGARATLARQAAQREQQLFVEGIIPQRRVQEAQAALKEAEAALQQAKAALRLSGMSAVAVKRVAASGKPQDSITLAAANSGIVTEINVKTGQRVDAATALLHVAQIDSLWLDIQLPATEIANWPAGSKVKVVGREITARILGASPTVSSGSQTLTLHSAIEGSPGQVRPGEFVTVELSVVATKDSWDVPLSALAHDADQAYVFVRTSEGFEARPVKVVVSAGQRVRVQGALKGGEQIAASGVVALKGAWLVAKEKQ